MQKLRDCNKCGAELSLERHISEEWNGKDWCIWRHTIEVSCNSCIETIREYDIGCPDDAPDPFEEFGLKDE